MSKTPTSERKPAPAPAKAVPADKEAADDGPPVEAIAADKGVPDLKDRRALADKYSPFVRSIAGKVKKTVAKEIDYEDLVEYGMIGLFEAADRYDPKFGANFMTFAYYRIRGAIYDGLRGMGWMSRTEYARARFEERANEYLEQVAAAREAGTEPPENPFEHAVQDLASAVQGLAAVYITTIDGTEGLQIKDDKNPAPEESLGLEQARSLVRSTITKLNDQERQLLEMYYYKELSLQEVGEKLGLSKSWTSRLHARVIEKLHRLLESQLAT
ncbi:MAG: sigma-70 family RNA polymerase sigma factor [Deltaproteobacteria bacterium]|nr:sigma-70 family RNA polymerase sigma factor [Deltaproteobacteria bacterium]